MPRYVPDLVSIITPAYNSSATLAETITSVLIQTYLSWELIVINDCSTDETPEIVRAFAQTDRRIQLVNNIRNVGPAGSRKNGIVLAEGQYLSYLDSDDLWLPNKLEIQVHFMENHRAAFSFTGYTEFSDGGMGVRRVAPSVVGYQTLLRRNVIGCLTIMLDRDSLPEVPTPLIDYEDYATWLQILRGGEIALGIPQDLARYRLSSKSVSSKKMKSAVWVWRIYRRQERLSIWSSAYYFCCYLCSSMATWSDLVKVVRTW